jgi:UDP-N-acetylglucosamine acyltransferase
MKRIHPSAIVDPGAELGDGVEVGPFCIVGPHVRLGEGVSLRSHAVVTGHTEVGAGTVIFPFATVGDPAGRSTRASRRGSRSVRAT